tara:strand:- start:607 stop:993 length:387 start_codon:yes stop_codon:yes gene_type:complete
MFPDSDHHYSSNDVDDNVQPRRQDDHHEKRRGASVKKSTREKNQSTKTRTSSKKSSWPLMLWLLKYIIFGFLLLLWHTASTRGLWTLLKNGSNEDHELPLVFDKETLLQALINSATGGVYGVLINIFS